MKLRDQIDEAVSAIEKKVTLAPKVGIILGTGLDSLVNEIEITTRIAYKDIPHFPADSLHGGDLVFGHLGGKPVIAMSGRFHYYEGFSLQQVTFPIRVAKALGIEVLIVSNAAGGLNPQFSAGDIMVIADHINLMGDNPLIGPNDDTLGPRFPDMCEPYTNTLISMTEQIALQQGIALKRGVYLGCPGPCLETRSEYRFMRIIGADAVGMSTVPEVIVAVHAGLQVLGFSIITDECMPDALEPVDIERIVQTAQQAEPKLTALVSAAIAELKL